MAGSTGKIIGLAVVTAMAIGSSVAGCSSNTKTKPHGAAGSSATPSPVPSGPATFKLPATLDGLTLSSKSSAADLGNATKDDLVASSDLAGDAVVGEYAGTGKDAAVLIGLPIAVDDVDSQISAIFDGLRSMDLYVIDAPKAYGTGTTMQCANATVLGGVDLKLGICVSADTRGSSILLRFTKDATETSTLLAGAAADFEQ